MFKERLKKWKATYQKVEKVIVYTWVISVMGVTTCMLYLAWTGDMSVLVYVNRAGEAIVEIPYVIISLAMTFNYVRKNIKNSFMQLVN